MRLLNQEKFIAISVFCAALASKVQAAQSGGTAKSWRTHWNGQRMAKDEPQRLQPEVHAPSNPSDFSWELQGFNSQGRTGDIPVYTVDQFTSYFIPAGFKDSGTRVEVMFLRAKQGIHYYGVFTDGDSQRLKPFWVAGYNLRKIAK